MYGLLDDPEKTVIDMQKFIDNENKRYEENCQFFRKVFNTNA